ncbi:hypothetical protein Mesil_0520 [Allomeiothermus silvanus DSM 9946]|uniref:Lipoprotein n=1 Tax=Allomeiothermus silvanus (strain ATCC 700542 / DSM 9946 / NBRC 106475 / NCIMB 13440 / VI-R2) TaxID=526227 RepID=D7BA19_ALLS1|nr:hypothetical protein [Allomeiothermus silvanus]ADH62453.1 hypothetical protein Mesil_0520 [Allomeiothermus silvanus DSM 9946]
MKRFVVLGGAALALLISGCDTLSGIAGDFQPAARVEVAGALEGMCVRLEAFKDSRTVGSWEGCTEPYSFRVNLPDGAYTLVGQAGRDGLTYQEGRTEATLNKGGQTTVALSRKRVKVQVTAAWLDPAKAALAEAWMLPQEARGVATYADPPPAGLEGRVLVAREVVAQGAGSLNAPTGKDVVFRLVQGESVGVARVSRLEADGKVVIP